MGPGALVKRFRKVTGEATAGFAPYPTSIIANSGSQRRWAVPAKNPAQRPAPSRLMQTSDQVGHPFAYARRDARRSRAGSSRRPPRVDRGEIGDRSGAGGVTACRPSTSDDSSD